MSQPLRRTRRHAVAWPCQVVRERDFALVSEQVSDASAEGVRVALRSQGLRGGPLEVGDALLVSFQEPSCGVWFDFDGQVRRVLRGRRAGDVGPAVGVEFTNPRALQRLLLRSVLSESPLARPARTPNGARTPAAQAGAQGSVTNRRAARPR
jgi:hypothetical protein